MNRKDVREPNAQIKRGKLCQTPAFGSVLKTVCKCEPYLLMSIRENTEVSKSHIKLSY
jgi:hypothetical protein